MILHKINMNSMFFNKIGTLLKKNAHSRA